MDDLIKFPNTERVLWEYAEEVKKLYQDNLVKNDHVATGNLKDSVECMVTYKDATYVVSLKLADYWLSIEKGRPPTEKDGDGALRRGILEWIKVKKILPRPDGKIEKLPVPQQLSRLSYAISKSIHMHGTKTYRETQNGSEDLKDATLTAYAEFEQKIHQAILKDVDVELVKIFHR